MSNKIEVTDEELEAVNEEEVQEEEVLEAEEVEEVAVEEPAEEAEPPVVAEEPEEAPQGKSGKWYHRQRSHVPGPRRKRKVSKAPAPHPEARKAKPVSTAEQVNVETPRETPLTYGKVDG